MTAWTLTHLSTRIGAPCVKRDGGEKGGQKSKGFMVTRCPKHHSHVTGGDRLRLALSHFIRTVSSRQTANTKPVACRNPVSQQVAPKALHASERLGVGSSPAGLGSAF